jgi:lysophospholipase L1-like esterase/pimeloyl-ACP methyl ester carboxylesterase
LVIFLSVATATLAADESKFAKWEKEIAAFEAADQKHPPVKGDILFVGSSSIRLWDVKRSFPELPVVNRGFGGSQIEDSTHFAERIIGRHEPRAIVFYAGDNDIGSGKSAETVASHFEQFVAKVRSLRPETHLFFVAIKPSGSRWKHIETQRDANARIRAFCERGSRLTFINVEPGMLGKDGQPREELFLKDRLHMTSAGYKVWNDLLRAPLAKIAPVDPGAAALLKAKRVVFLGDSITYSGSYIAYLETFLATRFPKRSTEFLNLGLPSETCSGLSEDGHAGGKFPRPDVHERLQRVLDKLKPDLVVACYGMNCGIYLPFSEERFAKYQDGIRRLRAAAEQAGAKVIHLTPPTYDPQPLKGGGSKDYNSVLDRYSEWLLSQRVVGWTVIDIHGPMNAHLAARRRQNPKFVLAGDGVHAGSTGHWLMTQAILDAMFGWPHTQPLAEVDGEFMGTDEDMIVPLPVDPTWDTDSLELTSAREYFASFGVRATVANSPRYDVLQGGQSIGSVTGHELRTGQSDLTPLASFAPTQQAAELLKRIKERQRLLGDAWLNEVGHLRPGMSKGKPIAEATAEAAELNQQIAKLARPVHINLDLKPSADPFPGKKSDWHGFDRYEFPVAGKTASVVVPKQAAAGKPWVWHGEFFGHKPDPDIALLGHGFHVVYLSVPNMLGCPDAVSHWNSLYRELTRRYGFASKPALVGLSRGGLYCYNWAAANPDKVACIYGDAPVCDFKSWPGGKGKGKGSAGDWKLVLERFHFADEADALAWKLNPIDNLAPLAAAKVPLLHVFGDADDVVPWDENTGLIAERYEKLGGKIELIRKPGVGHHPHGLEDSTPIVEFIRKHAAVQ